MSQTDVSDTEQSESAQQHSRYLTDQLNLDTFEPPQYDELLKKAGEVTTLSELKPLIFRLKSGSLKELFGKNEEQLRVLADLIEARQLELSWKVVGETVSRIESADKETLERIRVHFLDAYQLTHGKISADDMSFFTKEQIDVIYKAVMGREKILGIPLAR